jgi:hypothetical protein
MEVSLSASDTEMKAERSKVRYRVRRARRGMGVIKGFCAKNSPASSSLDAHPFGGGLVPPRPQARSSLWNPNTVKFTHFFTEKPRENHPQIPRISPERA